MNKYKLLQLKELIKEKNSSLDLDKSYSIIAFYFPKMELMDAVNYIKEIHVELDNKFKSNYDLNLGIEIIN